MRTLFIPLAKLLGIYEVFRPLYYILFLVSRGVTSRAVSEHGFSDVVIIPCAIHSISVLLALILIFKAERIADILKIPQDKTDSLVFDFHSILRAGLLLIDIAMFIHAIPTIITVAIVVIPTQDRGYPYNRLYQQLYASILEGVLGGCLVLLSNRPARFFSKHE